MPLNAQQLLQRAQKAYDTIKQLPTKEKFGYLENLLRCGMANLTDYDCYDYWTLKPTAPKPLPKSRFYNQISLRKKQRLTLELTNTAAFLIIKDDSLIFEQYFSQYDSTSKLNSFSMAKTITSLLIARAIEQGYIKSLDQKVAEFLPWFDQPMDSLLRIRDLLNMASGLDWSEDFLNPFSDIVKAYYGYPLEELLPQVHVIEPPNRRWRYQCVNYILAGLIIQKATGMNFGQYMQQALWTPIGAEYEAYVGKDKYADIPRSFCCIYATARDFAKLGLLLLHQGKWNGQQLISSQFVDEMKQPAIHLRYKLWRRTDFYKLGLWIYPKRRYKAYYFAGVFGQYVFILPEYNAVVVRLGQMVNQLDVMRIPPDVPIFLKIATQLLEAYSAQSQNSQH